MQDELIEIARRELADKQAHSGRERGYLFHHGLRTARLALWLAGQIGEDAGQPDEVLLAAGLLHDCGKGHNDHHLVGAARARELLAGAMPDEQVAAACEIIAAHNQRGNSDQSAAIRIIQDADVLDHHGAQHVWLGIIWNTAHGEPIDELARYHFGDENQRWVDYGERSLNFDASRAEFSVRRTFQERFFARFAEELGGPWPRKEDTQ